MRAAASGPEVAVRALGCGGRNLSRRVNALARNRAETARKLPVLQGMSLTCPGTGQYRNRLIQYKIRAFLIQKIELRRPLAHPVSTSDSVGLPLRNSFSAGTILISFICLFLVVGGMYFVNSRREASLLIPESPPAAVSAVAQRFQEQVLPSLLALQERAKGAVAVLPEEHAPQEMPVGETAVIAEMQQVPLEQEPPSEPSVINGVIAKGDSASELLSPYMSANSVQQLLNVTRKLHPLNDLRTGQPYTLVCSPDGGDMERFEYEINDRKKLIVTKTDEGLVAHVEPIVYDFSLVRVSGTIRSSLFETLASTGESPILAVRIADIFGSEINFIKDLREGDSFSLLIEKRFRENDFKGYGKVLGATFTNQGKTYEAYNFATDDGEAFFNAKGESLKKTLLKAPLAFTRISSGYSMNRKHPIFKTHKPHQGVDYAAPTGTPVKAVGDGTIEKAGWGNGYGNMVILKHSGGLESMYSHLSGFASGAKRGARVRQGQVIGYVGATGYATGPHLDFRLKQNGKYINPAKVVAPRGDSIPRNRMNDFKRRKALIGEYLSGKRSLSDYSR